MREISFQKALDEALAEECGADPGVITLGTDFTGDPSRSSARRACASRRSPRRLLTGMGPARPAAVSAHRQCGW